MNFKFGKKYKKSLKSSQRHVSLGTPAGIAAGTFNFRAELDIGHEGHSCHSSEAGRPSSTVKLDEESPKTAWTAFHDKKSEYQELLASGTSIPSFGVDSTEYRNDLESEC